MPRLTRPRPLLAAAVSAAALLGVSASAATAADGQPYNYGTCVSYHAMFAEEPVREFTQFFSPLTAFEDRTVGPAHPDGISIGCRLED